MTTLRMTREACGRRTWTGKITLKRDTEMTRGEGTGPRQIKVRAGTEVRYCLVEDTAGCVATASHTNGHGTYQATTRVATPPEPLARDGQYKTPPVAYGHPPVVVQPLKYWGGSTCPPARRSFRR